MATANDVIKVAFNEVGYLEKKSNRNLDDKTANAGSKNYTKYARDMDKITGFYNGKKQRAAWCDIFVDWCFVQAFGAEQAKKLLCQPSKSLGAGVKYSYNYFKEKGQVYTSPKVGDQIFFTNSSGSFSHTGLVYKVDSKYVYTVEGNTSSASGVVANGGAVVKKSYNLNYSRIKGYGRPNYDTVEIENIYSNSISVLNWQKAAIDDGFKFPEYGADGEWGTECQAVAKKAICKKRLAYKYKNLTKIVQQIVGVSIDGKFGNGTKKAVIEWQKENNLTADGVVGINSWKLMLGVK